MDNLYSGSVSILNDLRDKYSSDNEVIEELNILIGYYDNYVVRYPEIHDDGYPVCISEYYFNDYPIERAYDEMEEYYANGVFDDDEINEKMYKKLDVILEDYHLCISDNGVLGKLSGKEYFDRWLLQTPEFKKQETEDDEMIM